MIHQFEHQWGKPRYWIDEAEGRKAVIGKRGEDTGQVLDYQKYRLAFRDVARNTGERTMIATVLPPNIFTGNTLITSLKPKNNSELLVITATLNSFIIDFLIRQKVNAHCNMFYVYQLLIPRLTKKDPEFKPIIERAAALICTSPEYDDLRAELDLSGFKNLTDLKNREQLRAELDAIIAHLYGITETELEHILKTFPIVKEEVKNKVLVEFKKVGAN